jgi:hypothetical protein
MLDLGSSTPAYQGSGEPPAGDAGGILGALAAMIGVGGSTPAYAGSGQPAPGAGGILGVATPPYQAATPPAIATDAVPCPVVDPDPFGSGPIAIVIRRDGLGDPPQ